MKILWVKPGKLLPLDTGGKLRTYNIVRHLARTDLPLLLQGEKRRRLRAGSAAGIAGDRDRGRRQGCTHGRWTPLGLSAARRFARALRGEPVRGPPGEGPSARMDPATAL